jgi:hypothetical protein
MEAKLTQYFTPTLWGHNTRAFGELHKLLYQHLVTDLRTGTLRDMGTFYKSLFDITKLPSYIPVLSTSTSDHLLLQTAGPALSRVASSRRLVGTTITIYFCK